MMETTENKRRHPVLIATKCEVGAAAIEPRPRRGILLFAQDDGECESGAFAVRCHPERSSTLFVVRSRRISLCFGRVALTAIQEGFRGCDARARLRMITSQGCESRAFPSLTQRKHARRACIALPNGCANLKEAAASIDLHTSTQRLALG